MEAVFWVAVLGLGIPAYAYVGYPVLLFFLASLVQASRDLRYLFSHTDRRRRSDRLPYVSVIIAAHNEEKALERTLLNYLSLDYPRDRFEILLGSDGSSDRTVEIASVFANDHVRVFDFKDRRGKLSVLTDCVKEARGDLLVFSDANTLLHPDAVTNLVRHFDSPRTGAVCGQLRLRGPDGRRIDEGVYWHYEVMLKHLESRLDSVLGANGAIYALRKDLFPALPSHLITEDFVIPMKVRSQGFRVLYDPESIAIEESHAGIQGEFRRRVRIGAGNWQALWHCADILLPWKGFISFAYWSHKIFRWLTPFLMPLAFGSTLLLLSDPFWRTLFALQTVFYAAAAIGYVLNRTRIPAGPFRLVFYFMVLNLGLGVGFVRGALGIQQVTWQRTTRDPVVSGNRRC